MLSLLLKYKSRNKHRKASGRRSYIYANLPLGFGTSPNDPEKRKSKVDHDRIWIRGAQKAEGILTNALITRSMGCLYFRYHLQVFKQFLY